MPSSKDILIRSDRKTSSQRGFALLISIILVAFVVLILLSLASFTRVETQVAQNSQKMSHARQNALFSLSMALGQLQKYAGADQRITASAQLGDPSNLNGIAVAADGRRHWVGVWGNGNNPSFSTGAPLLLNWLVSGNEDATFSTTNGAPPVSGVSGVSFTPSAAVTSLAVGSDALSNLGTPAQPFRLLLGSNSAGTDLSRYVAAPLRDITVSASTLPGFSATDASLKPIGRYAWWIGDEGVKARANLLDPHANKTGPNVAERGYSYVIAQRAAGELMDRAGASPSVLGGVLSPFDARLSGVISPAQLSMVSTDASIASPTVKERIHDFTTYSSGVLADVSLGGLKKDLTRALASDAPSANELARSPANAPPATSDYIFPPNGADTYTVPKWGLLRSFANTQVSAGGSVDPQPPTDTQVGISPVLTYFGVGFDFSVPALPAPPSPPAVTPQPIRLCLFPVAVLWNPYTVTLKGADYMVGIRQRLPTQRIQLTEALTVKVSFNPNQVSFNGTSPVDRFFDFKLVCPDIPPGQSIVFTLAAGTAPNTPYVPGNTTLVQGLNPTLSVVMDTGATESAAKQYGISILNTGSEADIVIRQYGAGTRLSGVLPPTAAPYWFQTVQRVGGRALFPAPVTNINLASNPTIPRFALWMQAGFSEPPSIAQPDSGVELPWIANASFRSPVNARSKLDAWVSTYSGSVTGLHAAYALRFLDVTKWPNFNTLNSRASAGLSLNNNGTPVDVSLWEFPSPNIGLLSIGQLQHANLSLFGFYPSYPIGNSRADFHLPRDQSFIANLDSAPPASFDLIANSLRTYYDLSWHLNRALWDRYFFSTVPDSWSQLDVNDSKPLPNARLRIYPKADGGNADVDQIRVNPANATSDPYNQAAANLLVTGGFNVNSASEQAWRAVLGGVNQLAYNPQTRAAGSALQAAFARFSNPIADSNPLTNPWNGYRQLDEAQIKQLATNIVAEVRKRGPFLSLAEFINRRLVNDATGLKGALQAAIDATTTGSGAVNDRNTPPFNSNKASALPFDGPPWFLDHLRSDTSNSDSAHRSRSAYAPKFLTQADILSTLGPSLVARSDTFIIRAYGETVNPLLSATESGFITGRAWCEAVVQRLPDYVDMADPALSSLGAATAPADTNQTNRTFGRRFKIISFRWLTPADI